MLGEEQKIKLILMFKKRIISINQLKSVIKIGFPAPIMMVTKNITERGKEILTLAWIYRILGQRITSITFEVEK